MVAEFLTRSAPCAGVRECRRRFPTERLVLLWLGSSVGNSSQEEAVQFFRDVMAAAGQNSQACPLHAIQCDATTRSCCLHAYSVDQSGRTS